MQQDRLCMRESAEAGLAVIGAHAGGADAAEGQVFGDEMDHRVVHGDAAGGVRARSSLQVLVFRPEIIEGERPGAGVDEFHRGVEDLVRRGPAGSVRKSPPA